MNPISDKVFVEGLEIDALIGVYDWERLIQQRLVFDIEMETDIKKAASTDDVQYALDYASVSEAVMTYVSESSFELIEALAEEVAKLILERFNVSRICLKLSKPGAVPQAKNVAVQIVRAR